jgi:hypothetical protein
MTNEEADLLDKLILDGAVEVAAIDSSTGQFMYVITPKMKDVFPEMYKEYQESVHNDIMKLWENGFLSIDFTEENPMVFLTDKAYSQHDLSMLPEQDFLALEEIKRVTKNKF